MDNYKKFFVLMKKDNIYRPKWHLMFHIIARSQWMGNPRFYATWADEGCQRILKSVLQNCHQMTFEASCYSKLEGALSMAAGKKRKLEF